MNSTISLPTLAVVVAAIIMAIALFAVLGHRIASRYVAARNNLGAVFGGIFGLLALITVGSFFSAIEHGIIALLVTFIYTTFVVRLQRGY